MFGEFRISLFDSFVEASDVSLGKLLRCVPLPVREGSCSQRFIKVWPCTVEMSSDPIAIYNAIHRGIEPELIPVCRRFGIEIVTFNPIAGCVKCT